MAVTLARLKAVGLELVASGGAGFAGGYAGVVGHLRQRAVVSYEQDGPTDGLMKLAREDLRRLWGRLVDLDHRTAAVLAGSAAVECQLR